MTATSPTRAPAHLPIGCCRGLAPKHLCRCERDCCDDNSPNLPNCTKSQTGVASDRDALCLPLMTDEQALATWERLKAARKAYVAAVLSEIAE